MKRKHWIGIRREPDGEKDRRKAGIVSCIRKQENAAKQGKRFRGWGQQSQMKVLYKCPVFLVEGNNYCYYYYYY
jgi:hypothetical protein